MAERVTIQDIADALNISRNTASKAINNTGVLAESTRIRVLQKAKEMGYKQFSYVSITDNTDDLLQKDKEIALLIGNTVQNSHFASTMLDKIQRELAQIGYSLTLHQLLPSEIENINLPPTFRKERTAGIICLEIFNYDYAKMLCSLGPAVLFVDTPADIANHPLKADRLYMDNQTNIHAFVREMVRRGKKRIGFIGEKMHCQSFFERYTAFRQAMDSCGLSVDYNFCLTDDCKDQYMEYLPARLEQMKELPDVFLCANDTVAIYVLQIFKKMGISVPGDVYLCGFDDSPESRITTPTLSTVHIHSQIMGFSAVHLLISRIKEPSLNYRCMYTETTLIYRESTEK